MRIEKQNGQQEELPGSKFSGNPLRQIAVADVGEDADNIRYDGAAKRLYVG